MKTMFARIMAAVMMLAVMASFTGCGALGERLNEIEEQREQILAEAAQIKERSEENREKIEESGKEIMESINNLKEQRQRQHSFEELIESFVPDGLNTYAMSIGQEHKPMAAAWLSSGGEVYTSDANVVTVSELGKVTAVGEGQAYVVICLGSMYQVYRYTVSAN